jgi:hypothetical protein
MTGTLSGPRETLLLSTTRRQMSLILRTVVVVLQTSPWHAIVVHGIQVFVPPRVRPPGHEHRQRELRTYGGVGVVKVAIAFFGIPRNSAVCFPSIQKNILDVLPPSADVECFYHLYSEREILNPRSGEAGLLDEKNYLPFIPMQGVLEEPELCLDRWDFERIRRLGDYWDDNFRSLRNLIHQLNSLHAVTELLAPSTPDYVLFVRPDVFYHDALPTYLFSRVEKRARNIYIPSWQWWNGANDRFAVCGRGIYRAYGSRIEYVPSFCDRYRQPLHSERLLKHALNINGARICAINTRLSRVRIDGRFVPESFRSWPTAGQKKNQVSVRISEIRTLLDRIA